MSDDREGTRIAGRYRVIEADDREERGVDEADGAPVLVRPAVTGGLTQVKFLEQEEIERVARVAMSLDTPWRLPVLCPAPRVVYAVPPPAARPEAPLATPDAAECLLQLCDVLARAHAAGVAGFGADIHDVRVHREAGAWRITVVLPHLPPRGRWSHARLPPWWLTSVERDVWTAVSFFRDLLLGRVPPVNDQFRDPAPPLPPFGDDEVHAALSRILSEKRGAEAGEGGASGREDKGPTDIASLAERVLPLCRAPAAWGPRVAAMPRVASVPERRDWDRLIELGEEERVASGRTRDPYLLYPLAAAYHQRACVAYSRGDLAAALRDLEEAISLDRWPRYLVTRGVVRAALGDHEGAGSDYDAAVAVARPSEPLDGIARDPDLVSHWEWPGAIPAEGARACYARGVTRCRDGDLAGAREDLEEALQAIEVTRYQSFPFDGQDGKPGAFEITVLRAFLVVLRRTLRASPGESRWRWGIARTLRKLGREEEARAEADRILELFPGDERERKRYARMFEKKAP